MDVEGTVLRGPDFEAVEGRVVIEEGRIAAVEAANVETEDIILPAFVNAHTHLGDAIAKEAGEGLTLEELVAPPDGLKHRLLRSADRAELVTGMRRALSFAETTGTGTVVDFREGGREGVELLRSAAEETAVTVLALGRDSAAAMEAGDGFGAPSTRDGAFAEIRAATREAGKLFGIHAGERDPEDIDGAFALDPDFLVHMVCPDPGHLDELGDREIPVVVCPRSNLVTGVGVPPIGALADRTTVALGTDNVMLNAPTMFREMEFAAKLSDLSAREILFMATRAGAALAGLDRGVIEPGREARLLVLDGASDNLDGAESVVRAVVRRAGARDVKAVHLP